MQGAPPPKGWLVQYVSGIEDPPEIKPGFWLTEWKKDSEGHFSFNFNFGSVAHHPGNAGRTSQPAL